MKRSEKLTVVPPRCNSVLLYTMFLVATCFVSTGVYAEQTTCGTSYNLNSVMASIDDVPYSAKPVVFERYGTSVSEIKTKPVSVESVSIDQYSNSSLIVSSFPDTPEKRQLLEQQALTIALISPNRIGSELAYLIQFKSGDVIAFYIGDLDKLKIRIQTILEKKKAGKSGLRESTLSLLRGIQFKPFSVVDQEDCQRLLYPSFLDIVAEKGVPQRWGLVLEGQESEQFLVSFLGIVGEKPGSIHRTFSGSIIDNVDRKPVLVRLDYENGQSRVITPTLGGKFSFIDEYPGTLVRLSAHLEDKEFYPERGRWLGAGRTLNHIQVPIAREFQNTEHLIASTSCPAQLNPRGRSLVKAINRPGHLYLGWCGPGDVIQEFSNSYFVNQLGMHDKDFSAPSDKNCLRIAHLGHSSVEAIQVPLDRKHNILFAEKLSLKLQRCVEVLTFEGDFSVVSEPRIAWIVENVAPDAIIFAMHRQMVQLLTPKLQNAIWGYKYGQSHLESFELDKSGNLKYVPKDPKFALKEKDQPKHTINGFPLGFAYNLPLDVMPEIANEAFQVTVKLIERYKSKYPSLVFALEYSHTVAECQKASYCNLSMQYDQNKYEVTARSYGENIHAVCEQSGITCVEASHPAEAFRQFPDLVFQYDAHYTVYGNYWQALNLEKSLSPLFENL